MHYTQTRVADAIIYGYTLKSMQEFSPFEQSEFVTPKPKRERRVKKLETDDVAIDIPTPEPKQRRKAVKKEAKTPEAAAKEIVESAEEQQSFSEKQYEIKRKNLQELQQQLDDLPWYRFSEHKRLLMQIENRKREFEKAKQTLTHERVNLPFQTIRVSVSEQELPDESIKPIKTIAEIYQFKRLELGRLQKDRKACHWLPWKDRARKKRLETAIDRLLDELNRLKKNVKEEAERKQFVEL